MGGYIRYHKVGSSTWYRFYPGGTVGKVYVHWLTPIPRKVVTEAYRYYSSGGSPVEHVIIK
jgi:hypothetical protein